MEPRKVVIDGIARWVYDEEKLAEIREKESEEAFQKFKRSEEEKREYFRNHPYSEW